MVATKGEEEVVVEGERGIQVNGLGVHFIEVREGIKAVVSRMDTTIKHDSLSPVLNYYARPSNLLS